MFAPEAETQWLYRGVHGQHPMIAAARQGLVIPGDREGTITAEEHNLGAPDDLARSPYTSWSERKSVAQIHAAKRKGGVVLRLPATPARGENWSWENSPDEFGESEILLKGVRIGAEVLP